MMRDRPRQTRFIKDAVEGSARNGVVRNLRLRCHEGPAEGDVHRELGPSEDMGMTRLCESVRCDA